MYRKYSDETLEHFVNLLNESSDTTISISNLVKSPEHHTSIYLTDVEASVTEAYGFPDIHGAFIENNFKGISVKAKDHKKSLVVDLFFPHLTGFEAVKIITEPEPIKEETQHLEIYLPASDDKQLEPSERQGFIAAYLVDLANEVDNDTILTEENKLLDIVYNEGCRIQGAFVTKAKSTDDGVILSYKHPVHNADEDLLKMTGGVDVNLQNKEYHWLLEKIEQVRVMPPKSFVALHTVGSDIFGLSYYLVE